MTVTSFCSQIFTRTQSSDLSVCLLSDGTKVQMIMDGNSSAFNDENDAEEQRVDVDVDVPEEDTTDPKQSTK